ncbi:nucleoprotein TPR isoform X2 [Ischnura elegans]|uniref:nucleoprotein TPR isoform X2 n=1 Tax=Ischnura elegans TaxID=197161 RepID=UPI001ED88937|nr:nucleoprotein TPR isoform X2 [Ischnura elegans]
MMLVPLILTEDEYARVPEDIAKKIDDYITTKANNFKRFKEFHDTSQSENEERVTKLENDVSEAHRDLADAKKEAEVAENKIQELQSNLSEVKSKLESLREVSERLEAENASLNRKQTAYCEEREDLLRRLERRDNEIERLNVDNKTLSDQLLAASAAKCEALAHADQIEAKEVELLNREKRMEQEHKILTSRIHDLTETVNSHSTDLANARREYTTRQIALETQLSEATQKLQIAEETIGTLRKSCKEHSTKAENLAQRLKESRDSEIKMQEAFELELSAQTRLADLYKKSSESAEAKCTELMSAITELKGLLSESSKKYGELEAQAHKEKSDLEGKLNESKTVIELLKKELAEANELLKAAKREITEEQLEMLSPSAAAASRLIKSGLSLTQIYSQYVAVSEELFVEKQQSKKLNLFLNAILTELEERTPHLKLERENYHSAILSINHLSTRCDELLLEAQQLREEASEARKAHGHYSRENARLKVEVKDLSRQVCTLLKEVEEARGGFVAPSRDDQMVTSTMESSASQVISERLVTFRDFEELQTKNMELLCALRQLSEEHEEMEQKKSEYNIPMMKESLERATRQLEQLKESEENSRKMLESLGRQRDMYRVLYLQQVGAVDEERGTGDGESPENGITSAENNLGPSKDHPSTPQPFKKVLQSRMTTSTPLGPMAASDRGSQELNELKAKLAESKNALKQLQEEYDNFAKEAKITSKMMTDEHESLKKEISELRAQNSKYASLAEFNDERFKILQENTVSYRTQIDALEKKNQAYNSTIVKHEQTILHLKDMAFEAQSKLSRAEVRLENLYSECQLLRESEARLVKERESLERERRGQTLLMTNLEAIRASFERSEGEGRCRLEARMEEARKEINLLRKQIDAEREAVRTAVSESASLKGALESERDARKAAEKDKMAEHDTAVAAKAEVEKLKARIEVITAGTKGLTERGAQTSIIGSSGEPGQARILKDAQLRAKELEEELSSLRQQMTVCKGYINQYSNIANDTELQLKEVKAELEKTKAEAERRSEEAAAIEKELRDRVTDLEKEITETRDQGTSEVGQLRVQLCRIQDELTSAMAELETAKKEAAIAREDAVSHAEVARQAEDKFARQVVLHSTDLQALQTVREELTAIRASSEQMRFREVELAEALSVGKKGWEERERLIMSELAESKKRMEDLEAQNSLLHDQLEELGNRTTRLLAEQEQSRDPNVSLDSSVTEGGEPKSSEQLLMVIRYLRKERTIASTKFDVANAENARLHSQLSSVERQLEDARKNLAEERERAETTVLNAARQGELLRKVETLNALTDSNRALRAERDDLQLRIRELQACYDSMKEELSPLQAKNRDIQAKLDNIMMENQALRGEAARWRARANTLQERANRVAPEDLKRAQAERDNAMRQLAQEREEAAKRLRAERTRLEEAAAVAANHLATARNELRELRTSVGAKDEELARITEDLGAKEALLTEARTKEIQIRKIAKNYKTKYEELHKTMEDEKKKSEEAAAAADASASGEPSQEVKDRLKDEAKKEMELKVKDLNEKHVEQLKEASEQTSNLQKELDSMRQEMEALKSTYSEKEERSKQMLKSARMKIIQLSEAKATMSRELTDMHSKVETMEISKEEGSSRFTALRSQYEGRISRLEKERSEEQRERTAEKNRLTWEIERLEQKVELLQRALEIKSERQGSKPSTSSGLMDKGGLEPPPTANIKPMAGSPSVSSKSQQTQPSVTIAPSRATPFASIRPMALPTRTVAVLPTAQAGPGGSAVSVSHASQGPVSISPQIVQPQPMAAVVSENVPISGSVAPIRQATVQPTPASSVATVGTVGPTVSDPHEQGMSHDEGQVGVGMPHHSSGMDMDRPVLVVHKNQVSESVSVSEGHDPSESIQPTPPLGIISGSSGTQTQVVAMVSPRQQQQQVVEGTMPGPSGIATIGSVHGVKRSREVAVEGSEGPSVLVGGTRKQIKRSRMVPAESGTSTSREEPEVREATSSQRPEHEEEDDEIIIVDSDEVEGVEEEAEEGLGEEDDDVAEVEEGEEEEVEEDIVEEGMQRGDAMEGEDEENLEEIDEVEGSQGYDDDGDNGAGYLGGYDREEDQELVYEGEVADDGGRDGVSTMAEEQEAERRDGAGMSSDDVVFVGEPGVSSRERIGGGEVPDQSSGDTRTSISHSTSGQVTVLAATSTAPTVPTSSSSSPAVTVVGATPRIAPTAASPVCGTRTLNPIGRLQAHQHGSHHHPQQQQLLLPPQSFEESVDDSIVPSTPTLFVPRRTDGFGEAVSSPQVPTARFTFASTSDNQQPVAVAPVSVTPSAARTGGLAQVASEGIDDTRMDLSQLEESGTGRSVPTTPLQVSPQGDATPVEMSSEVTQTVSSQLEEQEQRREQQMSLGGHVGDGEGATSSSSLEAPSSTNREEGGLNSSASGSNVGIPSIRVTAAPAEESGDIQVEGGVGRDDSIEELGSGLPPSQSQISEGDDQSREASGGEHDDDLGEGSEGGVQEVTPSSSGSDTPNARGTWRGQQTARRSGGVARRSTRVGFNRRQESIRPVPIVWSEPSHGESSFRGGRESIGGRGRGALSHRGGVQEVRGGPGAFRTSPPSRRMRGKPKGSFTVYQMRY